MKMFSMGDYYVWYCDWCDSRNLTPWARTVSGKVSCGGCHKEHPVSGGEGEGETTPLPFRYHNIPA